MDAVHRDKNLSNGQETTAPREAMCMVTVC